MFSFKRISSLANNYRLIIKANIQTYSQRPVETLSQHGSPNCTDIYEVGIVITTPVAFVSYYIFADKKDLPNYKESSFVVSRMIEILVIGVFSSGVGFTWPISVPLILYQQTMKLCNKFRPNKR